MLYCTCPACRDAWLDEISIYLFIDGVIEEILSEGEDTTPLILIDDLGMEESYCHS